MEAEAVEIFIWLIKGGSDELARGINARLFCGEKQFWLNNRCSTVSCERGSCALLTNWGEWTAWAEKKTFASVKSFKAQYIPMVAFCNSAGYGSGLDLLAAGDDNTMFSVFIRIPYRRVDTNLWIVFRTFWVSFYSLPLLSDRRSPFHSLSSEQTCGNFTTFQYNRIPETLACTFLPRLHWLL